MFTLDGDGNRCYTGKPRTGDYYNILHIANKKKHTVDAPLDMVRQLGQVPSAQKVCFVVTAKTNCLYDNLR